MDHVVETAGTAAIAGHIAEGSHRLVLNEVSKRMILLPRSRTEGKTLSADTAANSFQARPYWGLDSV
jgi:hypothetical protein